VDRPLLQVTGLSKAYAAPVLRQVDLAVAAGEVLALVGENGAGKSTLCRIVAGLVRPDAGELILRGARFRPRSRAEAEKQGVRLLMQELSLVPTLSVAENLLLLELPARLGWIDRRALRSEARRRLERVGLAELDPDRPLAMLGAGQQQMVEIAVALAHACDVLILDEPTASLSDRETGQLFDQIRRATGAGAAVVYVSHRLDEVRRVAGRIAVLRDGQLVAVHPAAAVTTPELVRAMAGREVEGATLAQRTPGRTPALRVDRLRAGPVREATFAVNAGEILGLAGLVGSGRSEVLRAVFGADARQGGEIRIGTDDRPVPIRSPRDAVRHGLALVAEDRQRQGLLLPLSVKANLTLGRLRALAGRLGVLDGDAERAAARAQVEALGVRCASVEQPVAELSGGNQQKVVLGRWLARESDVWLLDEPTRGVDAAARAEIHRWLRARAARGQAAVVVSSDLDELLTLCDRIAVMSRGVLVATFDRERFRREDVLQAALGATTSGAASA
jgi:ribose transport system ATP-binding protein